jgi:hypothetical protein
MNISRFLRGAFFSFFWKAAFLGVGCVVLGKGFAAYNFWIVVVSVPVLALPLSLGAIYSSVIKQTRGLHMFAERGRLYGLMSGRVIRTAFWILWALGSSFFMLLQFHSYNLFEWVCFFLAIPVFYVVLTLLRRWFGPEIKEYVRLGLLLRWASWGALGGAAAGAAIGSIIPGVGTVVGAVVGGVLGGIATGVAVDKLLLMLEEQFSRKEFKSELMASIEAARREFKGALN